MGNCTPVPILSIHEHVEAAVVAMYKKNEKTDMLVAYMYDRFTKKRVGEAGRLLTCFSVVGLEY